MIALIPIFIDKKEDIYTKPRGYELICRFIETVLTVKRIEKIIVVTNEKTIQKLLNKYSTEISLIEACNFSGGDDSEILPRGSDLCIQSVKIKYIVKGSNLMVLNFRNPLLSANLLDDVIKQFSRSDGNPMLSVTKSTDNPCQLSTYYKAIDIQTFFFIDGKADKKFYHDKVGTFFDIFDEKTFIVTHPFYFNWNSKNITNQSKYGLYYRQSDARRINYHPIESLSLTGNRKQFPENCDLFSYDTEFSSRLISCPPKNRLHPHIGPGYSITGISLSKMKKPALSIIKSKARKYFISTDESLGLSEPYILKIHRISDSLEMDLTPGELTLNCRNRLYEIPIGLDDCSGIICSVLKYTENEDYDFVEPFHPTKKLWDIDEQNELINTKTGKLITGRQCFPEIYEPDGSFCIMKQKDNKKMLQIIHNKKANAYLLGDDESVEIQSDLDYMDYCAVLKSKETLKFKF